MIQQQSATPVGKLIGNVMRSRDLAQHNVMRTRDLSSTDTRIREMMNKSSPGYTRLKERCRTKVFYDHLDAFDADPDDVENEEVAPWTFSGYSVVRH